LTEGNSKLQASAAAAEAGGPGLGGLLVQLLTAPFALVVDALSYVISVATLMSIRKAEAEPVHGTAHRAFLREIGEGLGITYQSPYLRAIAGSAATYNLFEMALLTIFVLYATTQRGLDAALLGLILATGSVGALVGSILALTFAERWGLGPTIIGSVLVECAALLLIPLADGPLPLLVATLALAFFLNGCGLGISNVHVVSLRQAITPDRLLGRVNASYRTLTYGAIPLGALLGGFLGEAIGLRPTLLASGLVLLLACIWVLLSPVRGLDDLSEVVLEVQGRERKEP
jgi:predicted MFS family arabinose efflux permease